MKTITTPALSTALMLAFILGISSAFAQMPQGVPKPSNNLPIDFTSASDIVLYIVLPVVLIVAFLILRARKRKRKKDGLDNN